MKANKKTEKIASTQINPLEQLKQEAEKVTNEEQIKSIKKTEKVTFAQHHQLNQLEKLKQDTEKALNEIEENNDKAKSDIQALDAELSDLTGMLDDLSIEELELLNDVDNEELIVDEEEIKIMVGTNYNFPQLSIINFIDFESLDESSNEYLKINSFTMDDDPLFMMLSATEVKDVLGDYKEKYGDVIPDSFDYGIMAIAGLVGMVCNTFFENKSKFVGTHDDLIQTVGKLIISNSKFKESFFDLLQLLKKELQSKVDINISETLELNPFVKELFNYIVTKHLDKLHQKNVTTFSSDLETQISNLQTFSPSEFINLCVDDIHTQKVIALIDIPIEDLEKYFESFKFEDFDVRSLIEIVFTKTDIVSTIEDITGVKNLSEIINGFLLIYDLATVKESLNEDVFEQLQSLISKIIDDSGQTMNLKKPIDWLKNQVSYDLIQLINSVNDAFDNIENIENTKQLSTLVLENDLFRNKMVECLQRELNKKDFSIYVFGEKIEVFNDLMKDETFLSDLSVLLLELKSFNKDFENSKFIESLQAWVNKKVGAYLEHNQILNFKLISDLTIEDFKEIIQLLKIDFSSIKQTGIGFFLVETIIKLWVIIRDNKSISILKKEPFAVKSSYLLCGAHLISNTKGFIDLVVSKNPSNINYNTLKMSIQYGFKAYNESLKRDQQIEADFNETLNNIYLNSF